jgi:hypothetical protein
MLEKWAFFECFALYNLMSRHYHEKRSTPGPSEGRARFPLRTEKQEAEWPINE